MERRLLDGTSAAHAGMEAIGVDITTAQMENFFTSGNEKELFGSSQPIAVEASRTLHAEIRALAPPVVGQEKIGVVEPKLRAWLEENPILDISFGRHSTAIDAASITAAEWGTGGLQSVGQIEIKNVDAFFGSSPELIATDPALDRTRRPDHRLALHRETRSRMRRNQGARGSQDSAYTYLRDDGRLGSSRATRASARDGVSSRRHHREPRVGA